MLLIGNKRIEIKKGNITAETSDVIVNPANSELLHGGGAARDIALKGGPVIDRQSRELIRRIGFLPVGKAVMTDAGQLPAKFVIHTVGPQWGEGNEHAKLKQTVRSCLILAELYNLKTISMPAISSGVFGFPKPECARILLTTCREFLQGQVDLEKVVMCNFDEETYQIFLKEAHLLSEKSCQF